MDFASAVFGGSLAFVRIASMVFTAPVLGHRSVPFRFKVLLSLVLTTVTFPLITQSATIPNEIDGWTQSLFAELAIGIFLGLGVQIVFMAAQMAGTVISQMAAMQTGDGNDTLGGEGSPVSKLLGVLSIAAFVLLGGPEQVVGATIDTFVAVPVGTSLQTAGLIDLADRSIEAKLFVDAAWCRSGSRCTLHFNIRGRFDQSQLPADQSVEHGTDVKPVRDDPVFVLHARRLCLAVCGRL